MHQMLILCWYQVVVVMDVVIGDTSMCSKEMPLSNLNDDSSSI